MLHTPGYTTTHQTLEPNSTSWKGTPEEQRQRLLEIAGKTPVTNTVRQGTPIATDWK